MSAAGHPGPAYELRSSDFFVDPASPASPASSASLAEPPGAEARGVDLQPGLTVSLVSFRSQAPLRVTAVNDHTRIHFSCLFQGAIGVAFGRRAFRLGGGDVQLSYAPGERFTLDLTGPCRNVELMVAPEVLADLAGEEYAPLAADVAAGFCLRHSAREPRARDAGARLGRMIDEAPGQRLMLHAAALEFLSWHLRSYARRDGGDATAGTVSPRDRKLLLAAREMLLRDLGDPPTIAELARATGLNQLKLKRGFKALFGLSVYALFQRERMAHARALLHRHGVTETAMMVGYSNVSHFSTAFRKQYGVLPRDARRGALD